MAEQKQGKQVIMTYDDHQKMVEREQMSSVMIDQFKAYIYELKNTKPVVYITERVGWYEKHLNSSFRRSYSHGIEGVHVPQIIGDDEVATALDGEFQKCIEKIRFLQARVIMLEGKVATEKTNAEHSKGNFNICFNLLTKRQKKKVVF